VRVSDYPLRLASSEMTNTLFDLEVSRSLNRLNAQIKYARAYFHDEEIDTAFRLYVRVLEFIAADPSRGCAISRS